MSLGVVALRSYVPGLGLIFIHAWPLVADKNLFSRLLWQNFKKKLMSMARGINFYSQLALSLIQLVASLYK